MSTASLSDISVDCVVFRFIEEKASLEVLLINRKESVACQPNISLPGDVVLPNEEIILAAKRVLISQTGLQIPIYRFGSFEDPTRLKPGESHIQRVITKAYLGFVTDHKLRFGDLAKTGMFLDVDDIPNQMLYDHFEILSAAKTALRKAAENHLVPLNGLPSSFTITLLQRFYEKILNKKLDKRNFRRSILTKEYLEETGEFLRGANFRPAKLYRFNQNKFEHCLEKELDKVPVILF